MVPSSNYKPQEIAHPYRWVLEVAVFMILAAVFLSCKAPFIRPRFSDGNVYLYFAKLVADGFVPYKDFFYSSPPGLPFSLAGFGRLFGFSWQAVGWLPPVLTVFECGAIWLWLRTRLRWPLIAAAMFYYLTTFMVIATTDFATDVHFLLAPILAAFLFAERENFMVVGLFLAIAALVKLYAVIFWLPFALQAACGHGRKSRLTGLAAGLLTGFFVPMAALTFSLGVKTLYADIILSHLGPIDTLSKKDIVAFIFKKDPWFICGLLSLFLRPVRRQLSIAQAASLVTLLGFYVFYEDLYYLYFKPLFALILPLWAYLMDLGLKLQPRWGATIFTLLGSVQAYSSVKTYKEEQADAFVMPITEIVDYVRTHTRPDEVIYGDFEIAPLVSTLSDRAILQNYGDNNVKFFHSGFFDPKTRVDEIAAAHVSLILTKGVFQEHHIVAGPGAVLPVNVFQEYCQPAKMFPLQRSDDGVVIAWDCRF